MTRHASVLASAVLASTALLSHAAHAQDGPYKVLAITKVGGTGSWDYVTADSANRRLYIGRSGTGAHVSVYNLDTLAPAGDIPNLNAIHGAVVDDKTGHGFVSGKPVVMFDAKTHAAPNVTVLDAKDGAILGTIDIGGAPEQAVSDGKGHLYIDIEDKDAIAVVDVASMKMTGKYDVSSKGGGCAGLAIDTRNSILFATCRDKKNMIIVNAKDGKILDALPTGTGSDGAVFNPATMEAFSTQGDGTLTIVKENSPTSFVVEQTVTTPLRARTLTLDTRTGKIFTVTAQFGEAPAAQPGQRPARPPMVPDSFEIITVGK
jgi:hypothetical protein